MSRHVSTGLNQINARQGRSIAINKTITLCWQIPVWTRGREALVSSTSHIILLSLHHQFCMWEVLVMAAMVKIEMRTNEPAESPRLTAIVPFPSTISEAA